MRGFSFRRPVKSSDPEADLTICQSCGSGYVIPTDWAERDEARWWMRLRCGECGSGREAVVSDATAQRYDQRLQHGMDELARALHQQEREQLARDAKTIAIALELDLLDADDFVG